MLVAVVRAHGLGARECEREPGRVLLEDGCSRWHTWRDPSTHRTSRRERPGPMSQQVPRRSSEPGLEGLEREHVDEHERGHVHADADERGLKGQKTWKADDTCL